MCAQKSVVHQSLPKQVFCQQKQFASGGGSGTGHYSGSGGGSGSGEPLARAMVQVEGEAVQCSTFAAPEQEANREIVLAAVPQKGNARPPDHSVPEHVAPEHKANDEIVLEAAKMLRRTSTARRWYRKAVAAAVREARVHDMFCQVLLCVPAGA